MKFIDWGWVKGLPRLLTTRRPEPLEQAERIVGIQLHIVLPAKAGIIAVCLYYFFYSGWIYGPTSRSVAMELLQRYFWIYVCCNILAGIGLTQWRRMAPGIVPWLVFTLGLLDGLFMAGLALFTGGFGSVAYFLFPGLILLNALSIPLAAPQLVLNVLLSVFYLSAGIVDSRLGPDQMTLLYVPGRTPRMIESGADDESAVTNRAARVSEAGQANRSRWSYTPDEPMPDVLEAGGSVEPAMRVFVLWLLTACCYGVQVLAQRQRELVDEAREFAMREGQLRSAARLSAEFAHQIKNPLAIINNAAYSLQRGLREGRNDVHAHVEIIQEEVERSDKIVTQIMGYAQLGEGRVERLNFIEELDRAIEQVFPAPLSGGIRVVRNYENYFPPLLMFRRHLSEIFINVLQNARESLNVSGEVHISVECHADYSIEVSIRDTGPGIPADKLERIFEAYYTTKEKGTGLGLAIVKHNIELYGGSVRAESELGKGARFTLIFPAKTAITIAARR